MYSFLVNEYGLTVNNLTVINTNEKGSLAQRHTSFHDSLHNKV